MGRIKWQERKEKKTVKAECNCFCKRHGCLYLCFVLSDCAVAGFKLPEAVFAAPHFREMCASAFFLFSPQKENNVFFTPCFRVMIVWIATLIVVLLVLCQCCECGRIVNSEKVYPCGICCCIFRRWVTRYTWVKEKCCVHCKTFFFFFFFEFSQFYYIEKCNFSARSGVLESLAHFLFWHHEEVLEAA